MHSIADVFRVCKGNRGKIIALWPQIGLFYYVPDVGVKAVLSHALTYDKSRLRRLWGGNAAFELSDYSRAFIAPSNPFR